MRKRGLFVFLLVGSAWAQTGARPVIDHMITASGFGGYPGVAAPGSWVEIYGSNLAGTTRQWAAGDFTGTAAPTTLDGVSVSVAGSPAYLSYISPTQINLQVPDGNAVNGTVHVVVTNQGAAGAPASLTINAQQPGLLAPAGFIAGGKQYVVAVHAATGAFVGNGSVAGVPAAPAAAGETLTFYGIGFGAVTPVAPAGRLAGGQATLDSPFTMTIGNAAAKASYAGIAPGVVGLYQFNVVVPAVPAAATDLPVQTTLNGVVIAQTLFLPAGGASVPGPPRNVTSTAGDGSAVIAFSAPASDGGSAITLYTATCRGGGATLTGTAAASPVVVKGLSNGVTYTCSVVAANAVGAGNASANVTVTPVAPASGSFTLTSSAGVEGGALPAAYTCDGMGSTLPLAWSGAPSGTKEYALLMTTLPGDGTTKWNWVLYHLPAGTTTLARDSFLVGTLGVGSDGPGTVYNPPCSQGPGAKVYTWTLYALSDAPVLAVPAAQVTGQMVTDAIASLKLGSAALNLSYARPATPPGSTPGCGYISNSVRASKSGTATVTCDGVYAYVGSNGITTAPMMNGITSTNLQIPVPQNFNGANAWKIPLNPALAAAPTSVLDGPLGVAINGVPIFNPCTQGGCVTGGDTKALGQLDNCNGHAGRADDYHYHAAPNCMMADQPPSYWDTHPLGWALDGFAIFGYRDADGTTAARDNLCGGNTKTVPNAPAGYSYHVTDAPPYVTSCLAGTPSPDLPNQGSKYKPLRQPPVTPFNVSGMTLTTDSTDGYQVLQFTSAIRFNTSENGTDSYPNAPGTYKIRYKIVTGADLTALLALRQNANATACWNFQFVDGSGKTTQPTVSYCK